MDALEIVVKMSARGRFKQIIKKQPRLLGGGRLKDGYFIVMVLGMAGKLFTRVTYKFERARTSGHV
jgi:hypothetical protein